MLPTNDSANPHDPYDLSRFLRAQEHNFEQALLEIRDGNKRTHWMWFIFPQFEGLALSSKAHYYSIKSREEAALYLAHPVLGPRLLECAEAVMSVEGRSAHEIFGDPDDQKLRSCATLFALVSPPNSVFKRVIEKYYEGEQDEKTLELMGIDTDVE